MNIQKKLSPGEVIDTRTWRNYIDDLDKPADKASKAFDYIYNNNVELKLPKNLSPFARKNLPIPCFPSFLKDPSNLVQDSYKLEKSL